MDPCPLPQNPKPNPNPKTNVYQISGVPVEFPYKPYGSQLAFMGRVISTLDRARRQGHCHALLESPTGTGKSLSLLCSSLAWQQHHSHRFPIASPTPKDPLLHGGGFVPEPEPSKNAEQKSAGLSARAQKKLVVPTIYYASRTHSQISQVVREFQKTSYRVPMAILASRKHYCTNKHVCTKQNLDEECKLLLKDEGCLEFKNAHKVKGHASLQKGGIHEVHDIEDLVKIGRSVKGCSYFAAQALAAEAQLVFCPYSYIINPVIRRVMDIDIKGSIVILDEAHNIEDMARDAGSLDVEEETLYSLQTELGQLSINDGVAMIYRPLYDMIQGIVSWIADRKDNLQKREFEHYAAYWTGNKAVNELQQAGITQQCFPILQECAMKAIRAASDAESEGVYLSGNSAATLDGLFSSLGYFFSENGCTLDYQLALQRFVKRESSNAANGWTCSLSLWCLNPAVVFRDIAKLSLSVILTSGTLSPMGSFASELGVQFEACMEAPHVIDVESQLWATVISSGPGNCQLNASYKTADGYAFQDSLGASLEEICKIVPGGALVFFPSYKLLEKLRFRWSQTGQWSRLNAQKPIFIETRGNADEFEPVLTGYYDSIHGRSKTVRGKPRSGQKRLFKHPNNEDFPENPAKGGAAFLAVCRGKVSEGIDFSDENARVVVIVGIPFPNTNDIQVVLKKKYNDTYKSAKGLLSGSEWYCHQAFRALNQAAGRCIRHRFDYGAIILLDERLKEQRNLPYISKWLRNSIRQYNSFDESMEGLRTFFQDVEKRLNHRNKENELNSFDINKENIPSSEQSLLNQVIPQKRTYKQKKANKNRKKTIPDNTVLTSKTDRGVKALGPPVKDNASVSPTRAQCITKTIGAAKAYEKQFNSYIDYVDLEGSSISRCSGPPVKDNAPLSPTRAQCITKTTGAPKAYEKQFNNYRDYVDLESSSISRCSESISLTYSNWILDQSLVVDTLKGNQTANPGDVSNDGNPELAVGQIYNKLPDGPSFSLCTTISNGIPSEGACASTVTTPERLVYLDLDNAEQESALNKSVNSYCLKKRKLKDPQQGICTQIDCFGSPKEEPCRQFECFSGRNTSRDPDQKMGSCFANNSSDHKSQMPMHGNLMENHKDMLPLSSDISAEKKLHICCLICKHPLGLSENNFLVTCASVVSSKVYLSFVHKYGPTSDCLSECLSRTPRTNIHTIICDVSSVDWSIFGSGTREGALPLDIWCEEDGCVFRTVSCPFCTASRTCLGIQIKATDASNTHLLNKVLFYADRLDIKNEPPSDKEVLQPTGANVAGQGLSSLDIEKYTYNTQANDSGFLSRTKLKLRLPKKEQLSSQCQDGVQT